MSDPIIISHAQPLPLQTCFTHRCSDPAAKIIVVQSAPGFSVMCERHVKSYIRDCGTHDIAIEDYTPERAAELDAQVRQTYGN